MKIFKDTKEVIRNCISKKERQENRQNKKTKGPTMVDKTLHRKL